MSMMIMRRIEGYGDADLFSGLGCLYCSFVFVMIRCNFKYLQLCKLRNNITDFQRKKEVFNRAHAA